VGILLYAQQNYDIEPTEPWYEKLQRWDQAKEVRAHSLSLALILPLFLRVECACVCV
jgi:hypothetical protein